MKRLWIGVLAVVFVGLVIAGVYVSGRMVVPDGKETVMPPVQPPVQNEAKTVKTPPSPPKVVDSLPDIVNSKSYEFVDSKGKPVGDNEFDDGELLVRRYLNTWLDPDPKRMGEYSTDVATYDQLVSARLPRRLISYALNLSEEDEGESQNQKKHTEYSVYANDQDGNTMTLILRIEEGKVAEVSGDLSTGGSMQKKGDPITREDRIQIIEALSNKSMCRDNFYIDFYGGLNYKGYTNVGLGDTYTGAEVYLKKTQKGWDEVMTTQDVVYKQELDKLGVPEDVQKAVWVEVYKNEEEWAKSIKQQLKE